MLYQERLAKKIQALPDPLARMVDLFVDFLLLRYGQDTVGNDLPVELLTQIAVQGRSFEWLNDTAEDGLYSDADGDPV